MTVLSELLDRHSWCLKQDYAPGRATPNRLDLPSAGTLEDHTVYVVP